MTQRITPNLWLPGNAEEAVDFWVKAFDPVSPEGARVTGGARYPTEGLLDFQESLAGQALTVDFTLGDTAFTAINAGPAFVPNGSISFFVNFDPAFEPDARAHLDALWEVLADGGKVLMPLGEYPFSSHYGWVEDRYGFAWQLILTNPEGEPRPFIVPSLMFSGDNTNRADAALRHYAETLHNSRLGTLAPYPEKTGPADAGSLMYGEAELDGFWIAAMDSGVEMDAPFNEAVSLQVFADDQSEIDRLWGRLSRVPESEQCGWCKDEFGVSWQIIPSNLDELMQRPGAYEKLMAMHKIVIDDF